MDGERRKNHELIPRRVVGQSAPAFIAVLEFTKY